MSGSWFDQNAYLCRLDWGHSGAERAAQLGGIIIVVDVLSFSTTSIVGVQQGAILHPYASQEVATEEATRFGYELAVHRRDVPTLGKFSLSPATLRYAQAGQHIAIASPNGATCCRLTAGASHTLIGALVNAEAVASLALELHHETSNPITVLACGERWHPISNNEGLRFALEDILGAGAILSKLPLSKSPEALASEATFVAMQANLHKMLGECGSGIELIDRGYAEDVEIAAQLNSIQSVPIYRNNALQSYASLTLF